MGKVDKKTIILVSVLVFVLLVLGLVFSFTKKTDPAPSIQYQYTEEDKALPWTIALSFMRKGLVEKLQPLDPVTIRIFVKSEPWSFIVTQPSDDAYLNYITTSPNQITIIK